LILCDWKAENNVERHLRSALVNEPARAIICYAARRNARLLSDGFERASIFHSLAQFDLNICNDNL
jgi:hypothetical protein